MRGLTPFETKAGTDSMYQILKWKNPNSIMRAYELTDDATLYYGKVMGGKGYQVLFPEDIVPSDVLRFIEEINLK